MPHKHTVKGKWTGKWLGQVKVRGVRQRKLFDTKAEAKAWEVEHKRGPLAPVKKTEPIVTASLIEWANAYLDFCVRYSPKTYSEKRQAFKRMVAFFGQNVVVETIRPGQVLDLHQEHFKAHSGHATNKLRKNLCAAWNWGRKFMEGFPSVNVIETVPKFPEESHGRYVPPEKDFFKVCDVAEGQDLVLLMTFLHTAARRGELYRLRWSDVDFSGGRIRLTTRKNRDGSMVAAWVPMTDELQGILLGHRQNAVNEVVFTQSIGRHKDKAYSENRGFPQELCKLAGVKPFGCHAIRHLTASILAQNNVPMVVIQQILRHQKLATTERYVRGLEPVRPHLRVLEGKRSNGMSNKKVEALGVATS